MTLLDDLICGDRLSRQDAAKLLSRLLDSSKTSPSEQAAFVAIYGSMTPTSAELAGYLDVLESMMIPVEAPEGAIDTCGTGGDGLNTINVSTAAAIVIASAGVPVAKHGNRAMSSTCGSADVLEHLGMSLDDDASVSEQNLAESGFAFLFAQLHHPALAVFAPIRRALRLRTVFNLLGPIANPARVQRQIVGVGLADHAQAMAGALHQSGRVHALVVRGLDGMDEISPFAPTQIIEIDEEATREFTLDPSDIVRSFGSPISDAHVAGGVSEAAERFMRVLDGSDRGAAADAVALNAGAGLYVAGKVANIPAGYTMAVELLDSGQPAHYFARLVATSESSR